MRAAVYTLFGREHCSFEVVSTRNAMRADGHDRRWRKPLLTRVVFIDGHQAKEDTLSVLLLLLLSGGDGSYARLHRAT